MPFVERDGLRYFVFPRLAEAGVLHGVFTRHGGESPPPWASLNVGGTVGDDPQRVWRNLARAFAALGRAPESRYETWQVHGADVVVADAPRNPNRPYEQADVILTANPEVTLAMRFADCVPVLIFDPVRRVLALVHAGWQGTVKRAPAAAVQAMRERFGSDPQDLLAAIGPSIGVDHYEVGEDVVAQVRAVFGDRAPALLPQPNGRVHFDLWAANRLTLTQAGVRHIEIAGLCTACHLEDWYSHRAERGRTGRFAVLAAIQPQSHGAKR